ncbi:MAG: hypothetical protein ACK58L_06510 [Planctomycetota bacterium]
MTKDRDNQLTDSAHAESNGMHGSRAEPSVLKQVTGQTRAKNRRRKPPPWAMTLVQQTRRLLTFLRHGLPEAIRQRRRELMTAIVSLAIHGLLAFAFAMWFLPESTQNEMLQLLGATAEKVEDIDPQELMEIVQPNEIQNLNVDSTMQQMLAEIDKGTERIQIESKEDRPLTLPIEDLVDVSDSLVLKGEFGGRSEAGRRAAVAAYGGNVDSEKSVATGLTWLQTIQREDGSWSFGDVGPAGNPGSLNTTDMGATSLALLCYLGSGNTHRVEGTHQETVRKGLEYLMKNADRGASGADLRGKFQANSGMYVQGIATICLCEAAAMEPSDKDLRRLAGDAVKFIERSQHRVGGGWRYRPDEPGDTSVVGWQIMALQSARSGRIKVQGSTMQEARRFLDSVEVNDGAQYAYLPREGARDSMTAVGLLCRMYLGWSRERPALRAGFEHLAKAGPKRGEIYYNYYATQVLHHWGGDLWKQWNLRMRDELVSTQVKDGPGAGSWDPRDSHAGQGGRIYQTALSLLTLEVYYRHLPIYRRFDDAGTAANEAPEK